MDQDQDQAKKPLGFNVKGGSKRKRLVNIPDEPKNDKVDIISSIEESRITSLNPVEEKKELVIPLRKPIDQQNVTSSKDLKPKHDDKEQESDKSGKNLDKLAEEEILAELGVSKDANAGDKDELVIGKSDAKEGRPDGRKQPLLMANIPKEILAIDNDEQRYVQRSHTHTPSMNL